MKWQYERADYCKHCREIAELDCRECEYRCPEIMLGNEPVIRLREMTFNCVRYVGTMDGLVMIGFDWPSIETVARSIGEDLDETMVEKMRILEDLAIKYFNRRDGETNGKGN